MEDLRREKHRLSWIINFINQDIDNLPRGDFQKMVIEISENIKSAYALSLLQKGEEDPIVRASWEKIIEERRQLFPEIKPPLTLKERVIEAQERLRLFLEKILGDKDSPDFVTLLSFTQAHELYARKGKILVGPGGNSENAMEYEFAKLIYDCSPDRGEGWRSPDYIKRCQFSGCKNFFVQIHKKAKNYCSNKCAWRAYSKFRREEEKKDKAKQKGRE